MKPQPTRWVWWSPKATRSHQWWNLSSDVKKAAKVPPPLLQILVVSYVGNWFRTTNMHKRYHLFVPCALYACLYSMLNLLCGTNSWLFWVLHLDLGENVWHFPVISTYPWFSDGMSISMFRNTVPQWPFEICFFL